MVKGLKAYLYLENTVVIEKEEIKNNPPDESFREVTLYIDEKHIKEWARGLEMKCNHDWIDAKDLTNDKICRICGERAMQGLLKMSKPISSEISINMKVSESDKVRITEEITNGSIKRLNENLKLHKLIGR